MNFSTSTQNAMTRTWGDGAASQKNYVPMTLPVYKLLMTRLGNDQVGPMATLLFLFSQKRAGTTVVYPSLKTIAANLGSGCTMEGAKRFVSTLKDKGLISSFKDNGLDKYDLSPCMEYISVGLQADSTASLEAGPTACAECHKDFPAVCANHASEIKAGAI